VEKYYPPKIDTRNISYVIHLVFRPVDKGGLARGGILHQVDVVLGLVIALLQKLLKKETWLV
jgi:hypothetical protein